MGAGACKGKVASTAPEQGAPTQPAADSVICDNEALDDTANLKLADCEDKNVELKHVDLLESQTKASQDTFCSESMESQKSKQQINSRAGTHFQGNVAEETQHSPDLELPPQEDTNFSKETKGMFISRPGSPDIVREGISSRRF